MAEGVERPLFGEQRSTIDVNAIQSYQFVFDFEHVGEWQCDFAAVVPSVSHLTFANDHMAIGNKSVQLVFEGAKHGEKFFYCSADSGVPGDGWRRAESKRRVFLDKTQEALRVHRIDGREELAEVYVRSFKVTHC